MPRLVSRRWLLACLLTCGLALGGAPEQPSKRPRYVCRKTSAPLTIDGKLAEPAWKAAEKVRTWSYPWYEKGRGPKQGAVVCLLWDDENLYLAGRVEDRDLLGKVKTTDEHKVWHDERLEFYFDPNPQDDVYRCWEFTTMRHKLDYETHWGRKFNFSWDTTGLKYAVRLHGTLNDDRPDRGYDVEALIPFKPNFERAPNLPPRPGDVWRLGLHREDQNMVDGKKQYVFVMWADPKVQKPDYHVPGAFGEMVFAGK